MSMVYCKYCLERIDAENKDCPNHGDEVLYGQLRIAYEQGYRDAKKGKENRNDYD